MALILYIAEGASCCERVRWALAYKGQPHQLVDVEQPEHAGRLAAISPFGRVPILELEGRLLSESMAMLELIEELQPEPPLNYGDPWLRARVREVCEAVNSSIHPVQNSSVVGRLRPDWDKAAMRPFRRQWIAENLQALAPKLWRDSAYAVGDRFTLADILVAVMARKARALGLDAETLPAFERHWLHLMAQPRVAASCPPSV
jgi:maleylacetoacetate isomerase